MFILQGYDSYNAKAISFLSSRTFFGKIDLNLEELINRKMTLKLWQKAKIFGLNYNVILPTLAVRPCVAQIVLPK